MRPSRRGATRWPRARPEYVPLTDALEETRTIIAVQVGQYKNTRDAALRRIDAALAESSLGDGSGVEQEDFRGERPEAQPVPEQAKRPETPAGPSAAARPSFPKVTATIDARRAEEARRPEPMSTSWTVTGGAALTVERGANHAVLTITLDDEDMSATLDPADMEILRAALPASARVQAGDAEDESGPAPLNPKDFELALLTWPGKPRGFSGDGARLTAGYSQDEIRDLAHHLAEHFAPASISKER